MEEKGEGSLQKKGGWNGREEKRREQKNRQDVQGEEE